MALNTPIQKIHAALYVNSLGFLKNPAEAFSKIIYDNHKYFYEQIATHKNLSTIIKIIENLKNSELLVFISYLRLILPLRCDFKKKDITIINIEKWAQWNDFIIDYNSYFMLYKIDKNINIATILKVKKSLESTYSTSWQVSLKRIIKWPTTDIPTGLESFLPNGWQETGLLSSSGYTVGKLGATEADRKLILSKLVEQDIKAVNFKSSYIKTWGDTNSLDRLLKIARTIAVLCRNAKGSPNDFKKAIEDWESDLLFLKNKYFDMFLNMDQKKWPET